MVSDDRLETLIEVARLLAALVESGLMGLVFAGVSVVLVVSLLWLRVPRGAVPMASDETSVAD